MTRLLGKRAPRATQTLLRLADYLPSGRLPTPAAESNWRKAVNGAWGMLGNDIAGDCVWAGPGHLMQSWSANAGKPISLTPEPFLDAYAACTGYVPGNPLTDRGTVVADMEAWWTTRGIAGAKLIAAATVDLGSWENLKAAIDIFGGAGLCFALPAFAEETNVWDVAAGDDGGCAGGHFVAAVDHDLDGITGISWGQEIHASWAFLWRYLDEAPRAYIHPDWLETSGRSPSGFDLAGLERDAALLAAGHSF